MNDSLEETIIMLLLILAVCLFGIAFIFRIVQLNDYNKCRENNFRSKYCEKYKNY